mmetsp:Transcript_24112/g.67935  ORF Transcript_24112/g.67935 Transcript_24112/m.67935 type:complete len:289 (-) Transcript_24112:192-1058(-)
MLFQPNREVVKIHRAIRLNKQYWLRRVVRNIKDDREMRSSIRSVQRACIGVHGGAVKGYTRTLMNVTEYDKPWLNAILDLLQQILTTRADLGACVISPTQRRAVHQQNIRRVRYFLPIRSNFRSTMQIECPIVKRWRPRSSVHSEASCCCCTFAILQVSARGQRTSSFRHIELRAMKFLPIGFIKFGMQRHVMIAGYANDFIKIGRLEVLIQILHRPDFARLGEIAAMQQNITRWQHNFVVLSVRVAHADYSGAIFRSGGRDSLGDRKKLLRCFHLFPRFIGIHHAFR